MDSPNAWFNSFDQTLLYFGDVSHTLVALIPPALNGVVYKAVAELGPMLKEPHFQGLSY